MELQKLRHFYTVAKYRHITKAAQVLYIAQPSLTQSIKTLEKELGVELYVKKGRNIVLTEYGEYLYKRLDKLLPEIEALPLEIENIKLRNNKRVRLNILAASTFVVNAILKYRRENPDVIFDFEQTEEKYNCDIVITTNGILNSGVKDYMRRCVKKENIYLAVPNSSVYNSYDSIRLEDVKNENFVMLSSSRLFGVICDKFCSIAGFAPKILFESDSPSVVQNIISTGSGVAFWPEYSWGELDNTNVKLLPISEPLCQRELIIELHKTANRSDCAEDFYEFLLSQL